MKDLGDDPLGPAKENNLLVNTSVSRLYNQIGNQDKLISNSESQSAIGGGVGGGSKILELGRVATAGSGIGGMSTQLIFPG